MPKKTTYEKILELEKPFSVPGTTIQRVMPGTNILAELGLTEGDAGNGSLFWCIGIGQMEQPKSFFYGHDVEEAVDKAYRVLVLRGK